MSLRQESISIPSKFDISLLTGMLFDKITISGSCLTVAKYEKLFFKSHENSVRISKVSIYEFKIKM